MGQLALTTLPAGAEVDRDHAIEAGVQRDVGQELHLGAAAIAPEKAAAEAGVEERGDRLRMRLRRDRSERGRLDGQLDADRRPGLRPPPGSKSM